MKKVNHKPRLFRIFNVLWYYKKFHYSMFGYALLFSLFFIYFVGAIHYDSVESDLKLEEVFYSNSLKEEVHRKVDFAIKTQNFQNLEKDFLPLKNKLMLTIQDYYNFKMYYDSHEKYRFIVAKERLEFLTIMESEKKYEVSIYSLTKKKWNSVYKHWLKYFNRSFRATSKVRYLTVWLFVLYPVFLFANLLYSGRSRILAKT